MLFRSVRAMLLQKLCCIGIVCLGLHQEACFATTIVTRTCLPIAPRKMDDKGNLEVQAEYLRRILADEANVPVCLGQEISSFLGTDGINGLLDILRSEKSSRLRERAALALAEATLNVKTMLTALSDNLELEKDEKVFLARLHSLAKLVSAPSTVESDANAELSALVDNLELASLAKIVSTIDFSDQDRASQGFAQVLLSIDLALAFDRSDEPKASKNIQSKALLWNRLLLIGARTVLPKESRVPYEDEWRAPLLNAFQVTLDAGRALPERQARIAMIDSLAVLIRNADVEVRLAAYGLLGTLLEAPAASEHTGESVSGLRSTLVDVLCAASIADVNDPDARLRAQVVKVLARLSGTRNDLIKLLVRALKDRDDQVRRQAVEGLILNRTVPEAALPPLYAMAKELNQGAAPAIRALSQKPSPEILNFLLGLIVADDVPKSLTPERSFRETQELIMERDLAQVHALERFGEQAIVPLVAMAGKASNLRSQGKVYLALSKLRWLRQGAKNSSKLELALVPALEGRSEPARQFAISLLARLRPYAGTNYSKDRSERLARRYLLGKVPVQSEMQKSTWLKVTSLTPDWNNDWMIVPDVAAAIVGSNSDSTIAADSMIVWLCARRRDSRAESDVTRSLRSMGAIAAMPVLATVRKQKSKHCRANLLNVLSAIDVGSDIDASIAMVSSLPGADSAMQRAILVSLARSEPTLPSASTAILAAQEKNEDRVQSLLVRRIIEGKQDSRVPPSDLASATASGDEEKYMRDSLQQWEHWRRDQLEARDPYIRLDAVAQAGDLGSYAKNIVAELILILLEDEAVIVREASAEALGRIGSEEALPALKKAQQSELPKVMKRADWAVDRISRANASASDTPVR